MPPAHSIHPAAERELLRAVRWYRDEAGIAKGEELLIAFEGAVERACRSPEACPALRVGRKLTL